jgi:DNA-binding NarL/FixJ family response regulator
VIITDAMPSLNGIEAARKIHQQNQKSKILFLTMHPELVCARSGIAAGASGYVRRVPPARIGQRHSPRAQRANLHLKSDSGIDEACP